MKPYKRSQSPGSPYYIQFRVRGKPYQWCCKTDDAKLAKVRAKAYKDAIVAEKYGLAGSMKSGGGVTFDELFAEYLAMPTPPLATREDNVQAFRLVLADLGMSGKDQVSQLSVKMGLRFQQVYLAQRPDCPAAVITCNSRLRRCRSVLSRRAMVCYSLDLPKEAIQSFKEVPLLREPEPRRELPTAAADARAMAELPRVPEAYRAFCLARFCGLRSSEIKAARRDWLEGNRLYIGGKEYVAKSKRWRVVAVPDEVVTILTSHDDPVSLVGPAAQNTVDKRLPAMLVALGFPVNKPLHSCRRLFGSILWTNSGAEEAQQRLGHQSISVTERSYARHLGEIQSVPFKAIAQ